MAVPLPPPTHTLDPEVRMTRRERFRLYASEHFTALTDPPAADRRGTVERQTRRATLTRLARLAHHPRP
ncbi:hypothetical protein HUT16_34420 [Kitasatospora sp. NA04385]|uniref:hypothetical protein n=1 Tax=Kitasatospora sp. NA04385 TaxID=2742135 RepID=UPI0015923CA3|nr:hypothetical protein [Kitasatospora sp. NA04385]QKW23514.1 hypothetical protein HUT16_34420 [Kitasatospora sp. NA04385]